MNALGSVVGLALQLAIIVGLFMWGRWVAKRQGDGPYWRWMVFAPWVAASLHVAGVLIAIWLLIDVFGAVAFAPPDERAALLSDGIQRAMIGSAICWAPGTLLFLIALVSYIVGTLRPPKAPLKP